MMHGVGAERSVASSCRNPLADRPKRRAARTTLLALLPSRDTPHSTRNCSSGTHLPWNASTIARQAAPHSAASICKTVGVLLIPVVGGAGLSIDAGQLPDKGNDEIERAPVAGGDLGLGQSAAGQVNLRPASDGPSISARRRRILVQGHGDSVG